MPARANVLGVGIHALDPAMTLALIDSALVARRKGYVCVTGVHGVMEARRDPALRDILNRSFLTTPDGMPTVWVGRARGHRAMRRVYGPDLMLAVMQRSVETGWTHFLYGGEEGVAARLSEAMRGRFPGVRIAGHGTPPFRPLTQEEDRALEGTIRAAAPDIMWIGLSTPKQERFMARYLDRLDATLMIGVGAAFDIHTARVREAPSWMQRSGLQWLHRLAQEPRRLWRRYLINNPRFVLEVLLQLTRLRDYPTGPPGL